MVFSLSIFPVLLCVLLSFFQFCLFSILEIFFLRMSLSLSSPFFSFSPSESPIGEMLERLGFHSLDFSFILSRLFFFFLDPGRILQFSLPAQQVGYGLYPFCKFSPPAGFCSSVLSPFNLHWLSPYCLHLSGDTKCAWSSDLLCWLCEPLPWCRLFVARGCSSVVVLTCLECLVFLGEGTTFTLDICSL